MTDLDCCALSERGAVCESNEDFVLAAPEIGVLAVADGMGGRPGGAHASRLAVEAFCGEIQQIAASRADPARLSAAVATANQRIRSLGETDPELAGLGTTMSAVVLDGTEANTIHVGDSRIYLFRSGQLQLITRDHTLVTELVERNHLTPDEASRYPLRHVLSRSLGTQPTVDPDIDKLRLLTLDWLVLATDGLSKVLTDEQLEGIMQANAQSTAGDMCRTIMKEALGRAPRDNLSLVTALVAARPARTAPRTACEGG